MQIDLFGTPKDGIDKCNPNHWIQRDTGCAAHAENRWFVTEKFCYVMTVENGEVLLCVWDASSELAPYLDWELHHEEIFRTTVACKTFVQDWFLMSDNTQTIPRPQLA